MSVAAPPVPQPPRRPARRVIGRSHVATVAVTMVAAAFAVMLTGLTETMFVLVLSNEMLGGGTAGVLAGIAVVCITVVSMLVSAIVTLTTVQHVVEEQRPQIALRRLLGATAAQERSRVLRGSTVAGLVGTLLGAIVGLGLSVVAQLALRGAGVLDGIALRIAPATGIAPVVAIALAVVVVTRMGTRGVLRVPPIEALGSSAAQPRVARRPVAAIVLLCLAAVVLGGAVALGASTPAAVLVAVAGGVLLSAGIIGIAPAVLVPVLAAVGRLLGRSVPARAAVRSAQSARDRTSGLILSLMVGVATVVMLATAGATMRDALIAIDRTPEVVAEISALVDGIVSVLAVVVGSSAVVAVLGFVTSMLTAVRQRTREIGLLRALGMTSAQVRWMVTAETVAVALVALLGGLALGIGLGWVAVWTMFGSSFGIGPIVPSVSPMLVGGAALASAAIALVAAAPATARARSIAPVEALRAA